MAALRAHEATELGAAGRASKHDRAKPSLDNNVQTVVGHLFLLSARHQALATGCLGYGGGVPAQLPRARRLPRRTGRRERRLATKTRRNLAQEVEEPGG